MIYPLRRIRSFVRRDGRMTDPQLDALERLTPIYCLEIKTGIIDFSRVFQRESSRVLEIGFGSGHSLLEVTTQHPEQDFIGIEMYQPGIGALLLEIEQRGLKNIRIFYADAVDVLEKSIPEKSLDVIQIFFPDPWPKRKHHKRRLIQPPFVELLATKLKKNGLLHLATDWEDYANQMMQVLSDSKYFSNLTGEKKFAERSPQRPVITKFEQRGERAGRKIWELQFCR